MHAIHANYTRMTSALFRLTAFYFFSHDRISSYGGVFEQLFPGIEQRCLGASPMFNWVHHIILNVLMRRISLFNKFNFYTC